MGFFGSGNLRGEVEEMLREFEEQKRIEDSMTQENIKLLNKRVDSLILRFSDIENQISQLKSIIAAISQNDTTASITLQQQTVTQFVASNSLAPSNTGQMVKLVYTGFDLGVFTVPLRLGVGDAWLKNAKANFILECEKGQNEGTFYPNPANLKVLAFNSQSNLSPVCDIVPGPSGTIVKAGVVSLDRSTNGWKVIQKCQIAL